MGKKMKQDIRPLVSVIVLNYNSGSLARKCVQSALDSDYSNLEVLYVDNASSDESRSLPDMIQLDPRLNILRLPSNLGFATGNNLGSRIARGKYLLFLNSDAILERTCISRLVVLSENDLTIGAAQPKILYAQDKRLINSAGNLLDRAGFFVTIGKLAADSTAYGYRDDVWASGACFLIRRYVFQNLEGFDEIFPLYAEDADLSWRIRLAGWKIVCAPDAHAFHWEGISARKFPFDLRLRKLLEGQLTMILKNHSTSAALKYTTICVSIYLGLALWWFFTLKLNLTTAVIGGLRETIGRFHAIWKKHVLVQAYIRRVSDDVILSKFLKPVNIPRLIESRKAGLGYYDECAVL